MKIAIVSAEFPPDRGGVQTYAFEYAREIALRGHDVTVFTVPHAQGELTKLPFRIEPALRMRRRLDRGILHQKFDVWHAMNAAYAWLALEVDGVCVTTHGNDFLQPNQPVARLDLRTRLGLPFGSNADFRIGQWLTWRLVKASLPKVARIFANSKYTEERLLEAHPRCAGKTSAAMVGVSEDRFVGPRAPRREGPPRLVSVCRLADERKNINLVLRALAKLGSAFQFHYTIIGDGWLRPSLEALAKDLGIADRVTFAGFIDRDGLDAVLLDSDLLVLTASSTPLSYEGFGLVYLEANACGCPTLAARTGGATEAVKEGVSGMFVDAPTVEGIERALAKFLSGGVSFDPAQCIAFARSFSWGAVVDHCLARYPR